MADKFKESRAKKLLKLGQSQNVVRENNTAVILKHVITENTSESHNERKSIAGGSDLQENDRKQLEKWRERTLVKNRSTGEDDDSVKDPNYGLKSLNKSRSSSTSTCCSSSSSSSTSSSDDSDVNIASQLKEVPYKPTIDSSFRNTEQQNQYSEDTQKQLDTLNRLETLENIEMQDNLEKQENTDVQENPDNRQEQRTLEYIKRLENLENTERQEENDRKQLEKWRERTLAINRSWGDDDDDDDDKDPNYGSKSLNKSRSSSTSTCCSSSSSSSTSSSEDSDVNIASQLKEVPYKPTIDSSFRNTEQQNQYSEDTQKQLDTLNRLETLENIEMQDNLEKQENTDVQENLDNRQEQRTLKYIERLENLENTERKENQENIERQEIVENVEGLELDNTEQPVEGQENLNSIEAEQVVAAKKGRKRLARVDEWLNNKAKKMRNTGQAYISRSKSKKDIPARALKPPCDESSCKMKCCFKINEDERKNIFTKYWQLGDINLQRSFIASATKPIVPKIRFTGKEKPRNVNNAFYFHLNNSDIRVCKKFFMATLDINDRVIRTVISKKDLGFVETDKRGKHLNHRKIDESIKESVRNHINSIPRIESHYIRQQSVREYIDGGKCLTDLHEDYKKLCLSNGIPAANYQMYSSIFNREFNISFFIPKKDQCELCISYNNSDDEGKAKLQEKYDMHLNEKKLSRQEKEEDKKKVCTDYVVAVYDLQAVLQCPKGDVSVFYYKSKLNNLNFTVTELGSDHTECYLWHEAEANRGADEIGSCVLSFIDKIMANYSGSGIEFVFFSDNCCGQQKNRFIFSMYMYALMKYPQIKSINHKYLITGHTQNEGDSVHSTIEKAIRKSLKSGPIYVPSQYALIIRNAKKRGKPYNVNELSYKDINSMKSLAEDIGFVNKNIKTSEIKVFRVVQGQPTKVYYKLSYTEECFREIDITRKKNLNNISIKKAYKCRPKLKENKKRDLISLVDNNHIPNFYGTFYRNL